jgi:predicted transcriptional regulator of viral defense system
MWYTGCIVQIGLMPYFVINEKWNAMNTGITVLESRVMALAQNQKIRQIQTGDLERLLGASPEQERKVLSGMARRGLAARVRRGLYLLPPVLPIGGRWSPGEALALTALIHDRKGRFQICGPNTFHRYGWDEQVPNRTYAYNDRISGDRSVGMVELTLIRVATERLGDTECVVTPENIELVYSSRARSLVDAVYDWSRFNSLPRAFGWVRNELAESRVSTADVVESALKFGNQGTIRRIGYLLEELSRQQRIPTRLIMRLHRALRSSSSTIPWIPTLAKRGQVNNRWGVIVNGTIPKDT